MKKHFLFFFLITLLITGCKSTPPDVEEDWMSGTSSQRNDTSRGGSSAPSDLSIEGNEWKLNEVYIEGKDTLFRRDTLPTEPRSFFTLNIDAQNISGVGAPNLYSAPYNKSGQTINIMLIRATMMASFFQPENLTEHEFFIYLQNTTSWKLVNDKLELLSKTQDGREARLVFSLY